MSSNEFFGPVVHRCQWPWTPGANVPWPPSPSPQPPYQPLRLVFQVWYRIYATSYIIASACRTLAVDTTRTIACHNELDLAHGQGTPHKTMSWTVGVPRDAPRDNELDSGHDQGTPHRTMSWTWDKSRDTVEDIRSDMGQVKGHHGGH